MWWYKPPCAPSSAPSPAVTERVHGEVQPGFEAVRAAFAAGLVQGEEWGAGLCVWHEGRVVVDLWGGLADREASRPWEANTMVNLFSVTKGLAALCFLLLHDRGKLDYDAPVTEHWPELAAGHGPPLSIRDLLNHRAGLIAATEPFSLDDLEQRPRWVEDRLAAEAPAWPPGEDQGYHAITWGLYAQGLFRRIAGESLGRFLDREIRQPLDLDLYLGLPSELEPKVATTYPVTTSERLMLVLPKLLFHQGTDGRVYRQVGLGREAARAVAHPAELGPRGLHRFNSHRVRAMELPWANAIGSARALCQLYALLAAGGRLEGRQLLREESLRPLEPAQSWSERDRILQKPVGWSQGFLKERAGVFSPTSAGFGHAGAGGALGWCDPRARLAIGYAPNKMDHRIRSRRALRLCAAIQDCLAGDQPNSG